MYRLSAVLSLLLLPLLFPGAVRGRPVTSSEALTAARAWAAESRGVFGTSGSPSEAVPLRDGAGRVLGYTVRFANGSSLILSGDTRITPVIAALPGDTPDALPAGHPLPQLIRADLAARHRALGAARTLGLTDTSEEERWATLLGTPPAASPFGLTLGSHPARIFCLDRGWLNGRYNHWNQSSDPMGQVYDRYTPNHWPAGCVAVEGAALLQYFGVRDGADRRPTPCFLQKQPVTLTPLGGTYAWELFPERRQPGQAPDEAPAETAGRAVYDVGVCVGMDYGPKASAASQLLMAKALRERFGFAQAVYVRDPRPEDYEPLIYAQLRCGAPVGLSIESSSGGSGGDAHLRHAVVAAGYGEDAAETPYTYVFMGWGGSGDAWYSLPRVENYSVLNAVITLIGPPGSRRTLPVCGQLTDSAGRPAPGQQVTLTYRAAGKTEIHTLRTGRHGTFGLRLPYTDGTVSVRHGTAEQTLRLTAPDCSGDLTDAETLAPLLPRPLPALRSASARGQEIYTDGTAARDEALRSARRIAVLSGPTGTPEAEALTEALFSDPDFCTDSVFLLCDRDEHPKDMHSETLRFGIFDPRLFDASLGWEHNPALVRQEAPTPEALPGLLKEAAARWGAPTLLGADISGPTVVYTYASFRLIPRFSDGVPTRALPDSRWTVTQGASIADFTPWEMLEPRQGQRGTVTVEGSGFIWGQTVRGSGTVRVVQPEDLLSLRLTAPSDLWLESMGTIPDTRGNRCPSFSLSCFASLADGTEFQVRPTACTLTAAPQGVHITSDGSVWYSSVPTERHMVSAEARLGTLQAVLRNVPVDGADVVFPKSWTTVSDSLWPGSVLRIRDVVYYRRSRGKETVHRGTEAVELMLSTDSGLFPQTLNQTEVPIPARPNSADRRIAYTLSLRPKGGRCPTYYGNGNLRTAFTLHASEPAAATSAGPIPESWLRQLASAQGLTPSDAAAVAAFAETDSDGDGCSNAAEFVFGTDPEDPDDVFAVTRFLPRPGALPELKFTRVPGRRYSLQSAPAPDGPWERLPRPEHRFFRVGAELAP